VTILSPPNDQRNFHFYWDFESIIWYTEKKKSMHEASRKYFGVGLKIPTPAHHSGFLASPIFLSGIRAQYVGSFMPQKRHTRTRLYLVLEPSSIEP
jgi:hypothetical protein